MSEERNWLNFFQERQHDFAQAYLIFAHEQARREPTAHTRLASDLPNLLQTASYFRTEKQWQDLIDLTAALWEKSNFLPDRGPSQQVVPLLEGSVEAARVLDEDLVKCARLNALGETLRALGQVNEALVLHEEALVLARQMQELPEVRTTLCQIGTACIDRDVGKALNYLQEAEKMTEVSIPPMVEIDLLSGLAVAHTQQGNVEIAIAYLERALGLAESEQDKRRRTDLLYQRGYLKSVTGDIANARADFEETTIAFQSLGHNFGYGRSLQALGVLSMQTGNFQQSIEELEQSFRIMQEAGDTVNIPSTLVSLGQAYVQIEQMEIASSYLKRALILMEPLKDLPQMAALKEPTRELLDYVLSQITNEKE